MNSRAMSALREVAVAAGQIRDEAGLARLVVERARVIARGDAAVLRWFDPAASSFRLVATSGTRTEPGRDIASTTPTAIREAFESGQPVIVNDYGRSGKTTSWGLTQRIRAQIAVPMMVDGRPVGTLAVLSFSGRRYAPSDAAFLSLVAALVAPILEALRLTGEVSRQKDLTAQVYDALGVNVIVYDRRGRPIHYNSAAKAAWQNALSDPSGERDHRYPTYNASGEPLAPDQRPFARALATRGPVRSLVVGYDVADQRRWALVDAVPVRDSSGDVDVVITSTVDITEVKEAQARQEQDAARLRRLIGIQGEAGKPELDEDEITGLIASGAMAMSGAPGAAVQMLDGDEVVIKAAAGFGSELKDRRFPTRGNPIRGCIAEGGTESTSDALIDPRCNQEVARITGIRSLLMAPIRHEGAVIGGLQVQSPGTDGFDTNVETTLELLAGFAGAAISRARATTALKASEQLFSSAFQASGVGMALTTLDGSMIRANSSLCSMLGYSERELAGMSARDIVFGDDLGMVREALAGLYLKADPALVVRDLRLIRKDGQAVWTRLTASLVSMDGDPRHVLLHLVDVGEERRARSILESEQERLGVIIEAQRQIAGTGVDFDQMLSVLSEQAVALTGASIAAVLLPDGDDLVVKAAAGDPELEVGFRLPINQSLAGLAFRTGALQRVSDAKNDDNVHAATARAKGIGAMVSTPLVTTDGVIGVLQLVSYEAGKLDETDVRTLQMISGFAAAAYQRAATNRRLSASEHRVRAVIDSAPDPIVVFNSKGDVVDFNPAAEKTFLVSRDEIVGKSAMVLLAPRHVDAFQRWHLAGTEANSHEYAGRVFESTGRRGDGSEFPMEIVITDLPEETRLVAAFIRDLTLREAQRESEAKSRLMAMMNHEVRTPLNSILGFAHLLKDPKYGRLTDKQTRYVSNIESSGNHLLELVKESLDLARLDIGRAQIDASMLPVASVLEHAADQVRPQAESKGLVLKVEPAGDLIVNSDRLQLAQVLLNLLSNAIRHTRAGGAVTLSAAPEGERVCIRVADTGDGISASDQPRLFEEFFQASNHAPGGIGLGLAISRRLVQLMGGTIEVESELGRGSTFTLRLPGA